jgi:hypothetical protein
VALLLVLLLGCLGADRAPSRSRDQAAWHSYDRFVRLFTPVSAEEADRLERGVPLDGPLYWTDQPVPEEAADDAIWMVMTIPYEDLADANEQPVHPGLGYREFELPPALSAVFPVERLGSALKGGS